MKSVSILGPQSVLIQWGLVIALVLLELSTNIVETGIGNYLKWQNFQRPQLGRIWDRDRLSLVAQSKIQSIRTSMDNARQTTESLTSFRQLLENLEPGYSRVLSKEKFLHLYFDFPGQWANTLISSYDLLGIDSSLKWERVLIKRMGPWISLDLIDHDNIPLEEVFLSLNQLDTLEASRIQHRGRLEEAGFLPEQIIVYNQFITLLKNMDPDARLQVSPPPRWFLEKQYQITRVGISDLRSDEPEDRPLKLGIEFKTDYFTEYLLIPVPRETANNLLSQLEPTETISEEQNLLLALPERNTP
ncbi:MAG: hypothetical protein COV66_10985 [Nitrospinae bacterium CG11_big_fil_rev_8_21_14_0_20_45_15]|nr:MAG: hypothetical protein COV66_10985 [Nitrospinae bacterium CG11_big_fil_rev_8_21_14_0_20_45_15]